MISTVDRRVLLATALLLGGAVGCHPEIVGVGNGLLFQLQPGDRWTFERSFVPSATREAVLADLARRDPARYDDELAAYRTYANLLPGRDERVVLGVQSWANEAYFAVETRRFSRRGTADSTVASQADTAYYRTDRQGNLAQFIAGLDQVRYRFDAAPDDSWLLVYPGVTYRVRLRSRADTVQVPYGTLRGCYAFEFTPISVAEDSSIASSRAVTPPFIEWLAPEVGWVRSRSLAHAAGQDLVAWRR